MLQLILKAILSFFWSKFEDSYQKEKLKQINKRILINEVKDIAAKAAEHNIQIGADGESIDDSLLRLERAAAKHVVDSTGDSPRPITFAGFKRLGTEGDRSSVESNTPDVPVSYGASDSSDSEGERPGAE